MNTDTTTAPSMTKAERFAAAQPGQACYLTSYYAGSGTSYTPAKITRRTATRLVVAADGNTAYERTFVVSRAGSIEEFGSRGDRGFRRHATGLELDYETAKVAVEVTQRKRRALSAFLEINKAGYPTSDANAENLQEHLARLEKLMAEARAAVEAI